MKKTARVLLTSLLGFTLALCAGCGGGEASVPTSSPSGDGGEDGKDEVVYAKDYAPTSFSASGMRYTVTHLGDGVRMVKNEYTLKNGKAVAMYATEIDLTKADIRAGASPADGMLTRKLVPYDHMAVWENDNPGQKVMLATNADYFGSTCVNAFVKDGIIIKDGHNDNGSYDYRVPASDVPASAPMLFGVKDGKAQIAAMKKYTGDITDASVKESVIKSKLSYAGLFNGESYRYTVVQNVAPYQQADDLCYLTDTTSAFRCRRRSVVVKLTCKNGVRSGVVEEVTTLTQDQTITPEEGKAYLVAHPDHIKASALAKVAAGNTFTLEVASEDGLWNGYTTILGCRHALVQNGAIPATVALENSNNAAVANVPRTAVGIKRDGTVVLFSVEGLTYGPYGSEKDTFGLSLTELAEFIRYYDCFDAANFDGGGSTQVIVRDGYNGTGEPKVVVRSSDTGSSELRVSRTVINAFLITTKK